MGSLEIKSYTIDNLTIPLPLISTVPTVLHHTNRHSTISLYSTLLSKESFFHHIVSCTMATIWNGKVIRNGNIRITKEYVYQSATNIYDYFYDYDYKINNPTHSSDPCFGSFMTLLHPHLKLFLLLILWIRILWPPTHLTPLLIHWWMPLMTPPTFHMQ